MCTMFTLCCVFISTHHSEVTMSILASQITGNSTVSLSVCLYGHQRKHESPWYRPVVSPHKGPVTRKLLPFDGHHAWYSSPLQRWGLLSQFSSFPYFPSFFQHCQTTLTIEYHVYIWRVSPQLSCGDTCQIWMWFKESNRYFCKIDNIVHRETHERNLSNHNLFLAMSSSNYHTWMVL